jgi:hypothetical protein
VSDTCEDGYRNGVARATEYLRGVPDCFLTRDDVPGSVADVPAFLTRIAKNIDQVGQEWQRRGHISTHRDKRMIRCIRPLKIGNLTGVRLRKGPDLKAK